MRILSCLLVWLIFASAAIRSLSADLIGLQNLTLAPDERVSQFDIHLIEGRISGVCCVPVGWKITTESYGEAAEYKDGGGEIQGSSDFGHDALSAADLAVHGGLFLIDRSAVHQKAPVLTGSASISGPRGSRTVDLGPLNFSHTESTASYVPSNGKTQSNIFPAAVPIKESEPPVTATTLSPYQRFQLLKGACLAGDERAVEILLDAGADPDGGKDWESGALGGKYGDEFTSPMAAAAMEAHVSILELLLKRGASVDILEGEGNSPLSLAVGAQKIESVKFLLKAGASTKNRFLIENVERSEDPRIAALFTLIEDAQESRLLAVDVKNDQVYLNLILHAVETGDLAWIASQMLYPIRIQSVGKTTEVKNAQEFLGQAKLLFTDQVRDRILKRSHEPLFKNWKGCMLGDGELWFAEYRSHTYDFGPWKYSITAFGGFAFQVADEIKGEEELPEQLEQQAQPTAQQVEDESARTMALINSIKPELLLDAGLYRIQPGDTGSKIAKRFSLSIADLAVLNPQLNWTKVRIGQLVRVRQTFPAQQNR